MHAGAEANAWSPTPKAISDNKFSITGQLYHTRSRPIRMAEQCNSSLEVHNLQASFHMYLFE